MDPGTGTGRTQWLRWIAGVALAGLLGLGCSSAREELPTGTQACPSEPVFVTFAFAVLGTVQDIRATATGPDMASPVETEIPLDTRKADLDLPPGEDRRIRVRVQTDTDTYTQETTVCVPEGQAVRLAVNVTAQNWPPVVRAITPADGSGVPPLSTVRVTVSAHDPDGDPLTYAWDADGGTLSGSGASVLWTAPARKGEYTLSVEVRDDRGGNTRSTATYTVSF